MQLGGPAFLLQTLPVLDLQFEGQVTQLVLSNKNPLLQLRYFELLLVEQFIGQQAPFTRLINLLAL